MAEATPTSSPASSPNPPAPKQYIKASSNDDALEPDALRGSEHLMKDTPVQDDEADRRNKISPPEKK